MKGKKYDDAFDGIDISEHQGRIHWEIMDSKHRSPKFIYARVMGKQAKIDPEYHNIVNAAHSKNIPVGSYIFFSHDLSVNEQYQLILQHLDSERQDLRPMIDVERESISRSSTLHLTDSVLAFASLLHKKYGVKPLIYSNQNFYETYLSPQLDSFPLWIANYSRKPTMKNVRPIIWQYSEKGRVHGFWTNVDLDIFINGGCLQDLMLKN